MPFWKLVLKQFDDLLVKVSCVLSVPALIAPVSTSSAVACSQVLLVAAVVDFVIAMASHDFGVRCVCRMQKSLCFAVQKAELGCSVHVTEPGVPCSAFVEPGVILLILAANGAHLSATKCKSDLATCLADTASSVAAVGVITETNAEQAIEELKAYEVCACMPLMSICYTIQYPCPVSACLQVCFSAW